LAAEVTRNEHNFWLIVVWRISPLTYVRAWDTSLEINVINGKGVSDNGA
jgi:hypothetical protein